METTQTACPSCASPYAYQDGPLWIYPEYGDEWSDEAAVKAAPEVGVRDANGNALATGDRWR